MIVRLLHEILCDEGVTVELNVTLVYYEMSARNALIYCASEAQKLHRLVPLRLVNDELLRLGA